MRKLHAVQLSDDERTTLDRLLHEAGLSFRRHRRARILLLADQGDTDEEIAEAVECGVATVERTRKRFAQEGLDQALGERPRPGATPKLDGKAEALVVALVCRPAPEGQVRWTLRQLAERVVGLEVVESISPETIRRVLKKPTVAKLASLAFVVGVGNSARRLDPCPAPNAAHALLMPKR
jgi:transposase